MDEDLGVGDAGVFPWAQSPGALWSGCPNGVCSPAEARGSGGAEFTVWEEEVREGVSPRPSQLCGADKRSAVE
jgi:hypothetical protein